jgi:hypothetical protein
MCGFSLARMRQLCGSRDQDSVDQMRSRITTELHYTPVELREELFAIVERAIMSGVPFQELLEESAIHSTAAGLLASFGQEWLVTDASNYGATALEEGLWGRYRKYASRECNAFLRALVEGIPLFGTQPPADGSAYAAVALDRLRVFQPHVRDLAELVAYRVGRKKQPTEEDRPAVQFAGEFCGWVDEIVATGRDLWLVYA